LKEGSVGNSDFKELVDRAILICLQKAPEDEESNLIL
jgi:hypothetical protein